MKAPTLIAPAKINLHLEILGVRDDGYHELNTLFLPLPVPCDLLKIEPGHDDNFYMRCPENPDLESASNLIYKAWKAFGEKTGHQPGIFVTLTKRIPMGGGLGGGSSDCAAMLRWLNDTADERALSHEEMIELGVGLGADVPFFLMDGPAWASGVGEVLTPATIDLSDITLVLACPDIHVDTPWAFKKWDEIHDSSRVQEPLTTSASGTKNPSLVSAQTITNAFEPIIFLEHPTLREIKEKIIKSGAVAAAMSGSGASLFGLFRDRHAAQSAARALEQDEIQVFTMELS